MLNETTDNGGKYHDGDSMYSLVSEINGDDSGPGACVGACDELVQIPDGSVEDENGREADLGLLILEGDEGKSGGHDEFIIAEDERSLQGNGSTSLSVPETLFLPSDIKSIMVVSGVTNEQDKTRAKEPMNANSVHYMLRKKWSHLLSRVASLTTGLADGVGSFNAMKLLPTLMIFATLMASFTSWRCCAWRNEALLLRDEIKRHNSLLPLTLSLLAERDSIIQKRKVLEEDIISLMTVQESLIEKTKLLEEKVEHAKGSRQEGVDYDYFFPSGESEDDSILSVKNCYVEASLSLGRCSKEWQRWWSHSKNDGAGVGNEKEYPSDAHDGFTEDMSKLMKSFTTSLSSTTSQSISYIENSMKGLSYDAIKDAFSKDGYIQSFIESSFNLVSNNDTGA